MGLVTYVLNLLNNNVIISKKMTRLSKSTVIISVGPSRREADTIFYPAILILKNYSPFSSRYYDRVH